jgi:hypothetical protein
MVNEIFTKQDRPKVNAIIAGFFAACDESKQYCIEIKEHRQKRSLDANAYYWVLAHKIAEEAQIPVEEIYREHVRNIGGNNDLICIQEIAVDDFCTGWSRNGIGWVTERLPSKLPGCVNVMVYYGSSTYDTKQMSRLIDAAISDCQQYGIEHLTPAELAEMLERWEVK